MFNDRYKGDISKLLYYIQKDQHDIETLRDLLKEHHNIRFVSLMALDLKGHGTDEKIPINLFLDDFEEFMKHGIQTDGSSVVLPGIATLNNAKVQILPDQDVNWFVDYNFDHIDSQTQKPVGTLKIPSFLIHSHEAVDSRSILKRAERYFKDELLRLLEAKPTYLIEYGIESVSEIEEVVLTTATELEFWVKTPEDKADEEKLFTSQSLKEQYWKKTRGVVRTALEQTLYLMTLYGIEPEMGHKEVGGVRSKITGKGVYDHVMEQLEIDWKYAEALQAADNEVLVRDLVIDVFQGHGLEVTFKAKPIEGVAGSGKHTHLGVALQLTNGKFINLFAPKEITKDYLTPVGYGALMGILKHYEVMNPFINGTNDALNRLKPGFEAPICIVSTLGQSKEIPSRNRSVLIGLIKDLQNPKATRFELRSPNPLSNSYLVVSTCYQAMLDGIKYVIKNNRQASELEMEISKEKGETFGYLEKDRVYRSEEDVFEFYNAEERNQLFGFPPRTVWENVLSFDVYKDKLAIFTKGKVFSKKIVESYRLSIIEQWMTELRDRILVDNMEVVRACKKLHADEYVSNLDLVSWEKIKQQRWHLMKDNIGEQSLFTKIREAITKKDYNALSLYQIEMYQQMKDLKTNYANYKRNLIDF